MLRRLCVRSTRRSASLQSKNLLPRNFFPGQFFRLYEKIECKSQQSGIAVFLAITGHEQQQQNHHQIRCVKILRKEIFQKSTGRSGGRCRFGRWRWTRWMGRLFVGMLFRNTVFPVSTVGLGNVSIINGTHLPDLKMWMPLSPILLPAWPVPACSTDDGGDTDSGP